MASHTISGKQKKSAPKSLLAYAPPKSVGDYDVTLEALLDCVENGDAASFREVLASFIETTNKSKLALVTGIGRRTLYEIMDFKRPFNPELSTLMAIFSGIKTLSGKK